MKRVGLFAGLAALIALAVFGFLRWSDPDTSAPETTIAVPDTGTPSPGDDQTARLPVPDATKPSLTKREVTPPEDAGSAVILPSFDVVRVEPSGEAVLAGRATSESAVHLQDFGEHVAEATANADGEWVIVLRTPLAPGTHELSLESHLPDGEILLSANVVVVSVPAPALVAAGPAPRSEAGLPATPEAEVGASDRPRPLAVLMPRGGAGPSRVIQTTEPISRSLGRDVLLLETVDYDSQGRAVIGGRGAVGVVLLLYLDGRPAGRTVVGPDGRWQVRLEGEVAYGVHTLRVDQLDASGRVVARVESPFSRAELVAAMTEKTAVIVQPGNSLWRIARRVYGRGVRYSVIFEANREQIRDPDLIYPGQIFVVPKTN